MQQKKVSYPFPSSPCRNYNIFGSGFDQNLKDWPACYKWQGVPADHFNEGKIKTCLEQLENFICNKSDSMYWTPSVHVIHKALVHAKVLVLASSSVVQA